MKTVFAFGLLILSQAFGASHESFGILAPYVGSLSNRYENATYHLKLDEAGTMTGFYAQWISSNNFQANSFFYYAPKVDTTNVFGVHLNVDYYPAEFGTGKVAIGLDVEDIKIKTEGAVKGLESFAIDNNVFTLMPRAGAVLDLVKEENISVSLFPYAGVTFERVSGEVSADPSGPAPRFSAAISENSTYSSLGVNLNTRLFHFIDLTGKYLAGFKAEGRLDSISAMANVFLTRSIALSYRFKWMELGSRSNLYHLVGLAVLI